MVPRSYRRFPLPANPTQVDGRRVLVGTTPGSSFCRRSPSRMVSTESARGWNSSVRPAAVTATPRPSSTTKVDTWLMAAWAVPLPTVYSWCTR